VVFFFLAENCFIVEIVSNKQQTNHFTKLDHPLTTTTSVLSDLKSFS